MVGYLTVLACQDFLLDLNLCFCFCFFEFMLFIYTFLYLPRYRSGIRGHMKAVVMDLLRQYLRVETQFQNGKLLPEALHPRPSPS